MVMNWQKILFTFLFLLFAFTLSSNLSVKAQETHRLSFCEGERCVVKVYTDMSLTAAQTKCVGELRGRVNLDSGLICEPVPDGATPNCGNSCKKNKFPVSCCMSVMSAPGGVDPTTMICKQFGMIEATTQQEAIKKQLNKYPATYKCYGDDKCGGENCATIHPDSPKPPKPPHEIPILNPGAVGDLLKGMNPLNNGGGGICGGELTIGCILGYIVNKIIFPLALIFFTLMIVWGGYKIVAGGMSGSQNEVSSGKQRLIGAILGLLLLASVYWIWQLIEYLTGIKVVS